MAEVESNTGPASAEEAPSVGAAARALAASDAAATSELRASAQTSASGAAAASFESALPEPVIRARGLGLRAKAACPFAGVDLDLRPGELLALRGRAGSGKTTLLLALSGRLRFTEGSLSILGQQTPRGRARMLRRVGLGFFEGVNDVSDAATASDAVRAELALFKRPSSPADVETYLHEFDLDGVARVGVSDMPREAWVRLGIALALAGGPAAIVVDDVESRLARAQSLRLMDVLARAAHEHGVAVAVGCTDRAVAQAADRIYDLS